MNGINLSGGSDFPHEQIKLSLCSFHLDVLLLDMGFFPSLFAPHLFLWLVQKGRDGGGSSGVAPAGKRHCIWDLYLAFATLLIKYFINNVNILKARGVSPVPMYAAP